MSASLAGVSRAPARRFAMSSRQSGIFNPCELSDGTHEVQPFPAVGAELSLAVRRDVVVAAAPLTCLLHPAAFDEAVLFESVEQGVERRGVDVHDAARALIEELAQLIAVAGLGLEEGQDEERGR